MVFKDKISILVQSFEEFNNRGYYVSGQAYTFCILNHCFHEINSLSMNKPTCSLKSPEKELLRDDAIDLTTKMVYYNFRTAISIYKEGLDWLAFERPVS